MKLLRILSPLLLGAAMWAPQAAQAADAVNGKSLFISSCSGCHGGNDPTTGSNNIRAGSNWSVTRAAISGNKGGMGFITYTDAQLQDIAAYIANPAAGTPSPAVSLSTTNLALGSVTVGSTATGMVTVTNSGTAVLTVSGVTLGGTNAADFSQTNNCASVATAASCTINVSFKPSATGARSASLSIAHNATGGTSSVALSGTGAAAPTAAVGLSGTSLAFGSLQVGMTSAAQTVTLTNTGTAPLTISGITLGGTNATDFMRSGTCVAGSVAAGASCTLSATFTPAAIGTRAASISVASNAAGSPHSVALSGSGTAAPPPPAPVAAITPMSLSLGSVQLGSTSAAQTVKISNTGTAALNVGAITLSGAQAAAFVATGCANTAVAAGASCNVSVTFKPSVAGAATASLAIAHNAAGSPGAVSLSGTGTDVPPTGTPGATLSPVALSFAAQKLNTASAAQTVTLTNSGTAALSITSWTVTGANAADYQVSAGSCAAGTSVAAGASCTAQVKFTPAAAGASTASLNLQSNAAGAHSVALSGTGVSSTNNWLALTQNGLSIYKISVEDNGTHAHILLKNTGTAPIKVLKISFLVGTNYNIQDQCSGKTLQPGKTCEIEIEYKGPRVKDVKSSDDKPESISVMTDTGDMATIAIDLKPSADPAVSTTPAATVDSVSATPKTGGCTIGDPEQMDASHIAMLLLAAGALIARRRKSALKA
jgi:Abnormal spindle-like microcephaly-assoc'd, ASPM-SPD-2-Hydin/Cytochrome C oxidase, cbb3-type, subunit III